MSSVEWKLEKDLCRCCHGEGSFKNLAEPLKTAVLEEVYADMLKECFDIDMAPIPGMLSASTYTICEACIIRLRDAADFKKQVLQCEERFKDIYNKNLLKGTQMTVEIKEEPVEDLPESDDDFKEELPQNDSDSDFDVDMDLKKNDEEKEAVNEAPAQVEDTKKRKCKKTVVKSNSAKTNSAKSNTAKTNSAKTNSVKSKTTKEKVLKVEPADVNDAGKKQGRLTPKFQLKDDDFKKDGKKFLCTKCDAVRGRKFELARHVKRRHYKIKEFICSICNDEFYSETLLIAHKLKIHNVDHRVTCNLCDKKFNTQLYLTYHIKNFHMRGEDGQRYKCEDCDYVTLRRRALTRHKLVHKNVKDMKCQYCEKSFKRKTTLQFHERIHTGDRRKVCAVCKQAFVQKASLNYHMMKHHPDVNF